MHLFPHLLRRVPSLKITLTCVHTHACMCVYMHTCLRTYVHASILPYKFIHIARVDPKVKTCFVYIYIPRGVNQQRLVQEPCMHRTNSCVSLSAPAQSTRTFEIDQADFCEGHTQRLFQHLQITWITHKLHTRIYHTQSHKHTHTHTHAYTHTYTYANTHIRSHSHSHTHARTYTPVWHVLLQLSARHQMNTKRVVLQTHVLPLPLAWVYLFEVTI